MTATVPRLLHGEVAVGDVLPELSYPVTATTVVLGALASRNWRPMHHDKDFAVERNVPATSSSTPPTRRPGSSGSSPTGPGPTAASGA